MRLPVVVLWLALAGAGCSASGANRASLPCPAGTLCGLSPPEDFLLAAELIPPAESPYGRREFTDVRFDGSWNARLSLPPYVAVQGRVLDDTAEHRSLMAVVLATRPSGIPGLPEQTRSVSVVSDSFTFKLVEGTYQARILPQGVAQSNYPPDEQTMVVKAKADNSVLFTLSAARRLGGKVTSAIGRPMPGVKVRLVDAATGMLLSSVATTRDEDIQNPGHAGEFDLSLAADVSEHAMLRLVAGGGDLTVTLQRDLDTKSALAMQSIALHAPPVLAAVPVAVPLIGHTLAADKKVVGARVQAIGDLSDPDDKPNKAFLITTVMSDADGVATLNLIPVANATRRYTVSVTPPADSPFAPGSFSVEVGEHGGNVSGLDLEPLPTVVGLLLGPDGRPVHGAVISVLPAASLGQVAVQEGDAALPRKMTDVDGRFLLRLELGTYDLQIEPPWGSNLPTWWFDDVLVTGDTTLPPITVPNAVPASVQVIGADQEPVPLVEVLLYSDVARGQCPAKTGCRRPHLRADVNTDATGTAHVLLPAP